MKRHSSGISMWRWERILRHIKKGRRVLSRCGGYGWWVDEGVIRNINYHCVSGVDCCPVSVFCGLSLQNYDLYERSDARWWENLSSNTRKKVILALAKHFKVKV